MNLLISAALDLLTLAVFAIPVIWGVLRGMRRCAFSMLSLAVSAAAAFAVSSIFAEPIYDSFFKDRVYEACYTAADGYDIVGNAQSVLGDHGLEVSEEEIREALTSAQSLPQSVGDIARNVGADGQSAEELENDISRLLSEDMPDKIADMLPDVFSGITRIEMSEGESYDFARACADSPEAAAEYAEANYAAPIATAVIKSALFFAALLIVRLIMRLAFFIFGIDMKGSAGTFGDRFGGAALGIVTGAANVLILVIAVGFIERACGDLFIIETLDSKIFLPVFEIIY